MQSGWHMYIHICVCDTHLGKSNLSCRSAILRRSALLYLVEVVWGLNSENSFPAYLKVKSMCKFHTWYLDVLWWEYKFVFVVVKPQTKGSGPFLVLNSNMAVFGYHKFLIAMSIGNSVVQKLQRILNLTSRVNLMGVWSLKLLFWQIYVLQLLV